MSASVVLPAPVPPTIPIFSPARIVRLTSVTPREFRFWIAVCDAMKPEGVRQAEGVRHLAWQCAGLTNQVGMNDIDGRRTGLDLRSGLV